MVNKASLQRTLTIKIIKNSKRMILAINLTIKMNNIKMINKSHIQRTILRAKMIMTIKIIYMIKIKKNMMTSIMKIIMIILDLKMNINKMI